jgi:hypothetical protein
VSYNLLAGIGLVGAAIPIAIAVELVLVGATAFGFWTRRRPPAAAAGSAS